MARPIGGVDGFREEIQRGAADPAREGRFATVTGAVLVGGASTRMGRDKARVEVGGVFSSLRVARVLAGLFDDVILVGGEAPAQVPGRRVPDPEGPACALRGLAAALAAARAPRVFVAAADLPLLTPDLVLALVAWPEADAVVPRTAGGPHPLCALYRREAVLPVARSHLATGRLAVRDLLGAIDVSDFAPEEVAAVDPDGTALIDVNTPEDLAAAEAALAR